MICSSGIATTVHDDLEAYVNKTVYAHIYGLQTAELPSDLASTFLVQQSGTGKGTLSRFYHLGRNVDIK